MLQLSKQRFVPIYDAPYEIQQQPFDASTRAARWEAVHKAPSVDLGKVAQRTVSHTGLLLTVQMFRTCA